MKDKPIPAVDADVHCPTCHDHGGCGSCYGETDGCDQCGGSNACLDCGRWPASPEEDR